MEERFEMIQQQYLGEDTSMYGVNYIKILRDKQTGVMYIYHCDGQSGGLTALIDKDGKPVTSFKVNVK